MAAIVVTNAVRMFQRGCSPTMQHATQRCSVLGMWFSTSSPLQRRYKRNTKFSENIGRLDPEEDDQHGDMEHSLRILERQQKSRILAMKYARARKEFPIPVEKRKLKWDTIEQIRFLYQEDPGQWTTQELAKSFGTTEVVVKKILKSKFVPNEKKRKIQDSQVDQNIGLISGGSEVTNEENKLLTNQKLLTSDCEQNNEKERFLDSVNTKPLKIAKGLEKNAKLMREESFIKSKDIFQKDGIIAQNEDVLGSHGRELDSSAGQDVDDSYLHNLDSPVHTHEEGNVTSATERRRFSRERYTRKMTEEENDEEEISEDEEEFSVTTDDLQTFFKGESLDNTLKVIQKGREFYDEDGEFLYRI